MKVYSCPDECPAPEHDFSKGYDFEAMQRIDEQHEAKLKVWLVEQGYDGEYTGCIARFPFADGYARYMMGDGPKPILIHLPHADGWHYPHINRLTKADIVKAIERDIALAKLFAEKKSA